MCGLGYNALFLSETSHTRRALPLIRRQLHRLSWHGTFGKPVEDHVPTKSELGSLRGCAEGVASISHYPIYNASQKLDDTLWDSCRVQMSILQVGHLPLRVANIYLKPGAKGCQYVRRFNTAVLHRLVPLVLGFHSPFLITGDFNSDLDLYEPIVKLLSCGWQDLAMLANRRWGTPLVNTCRDSSRHSFMLGSPEVLPFLVNFGVEKCFDLHDHDVLWGNFDFPQVANSCLRWIGPKQFDGMQIDKDIIEGNAGHVGSQVSSQIPVALERGDTSGAFQIWSDAAERLLANALVDEKGSPLVCDKRYFGRGRNIHFVKSSLWEPRVKSGRPGDFRLDCDTPTLQCRRLLKQVRRLKTLIHLLERDGSRYESPSCEAIALWKAISVAPGFKPNFAQWCLDQGCPFFPLDLPSKEIAISISDFIAERLKLLSAQIAANKRKKYVESLEVSFKQEGGRLPFRLLKAVQAPAASELSAYQAIRFQEAKISDDETLFLLGCSTEVQPGDSIWVDKIVTTVTVVGDDFISVSGLFPEARVLERKIILCHPEEMSDQFFQQWDRFWNPSDCHVSDREIRMIERLPNLGSFHFKPITWEDWCRSLKKAKTKTMVGTDGWSIWELQWLPKMVVEPLLSIHRAIEEQGMDWPPLLVRGFLIWLNKDPDSLETIPWDKVRPITVLSCIYRVLARVRARQCLGFARKSTLMFVQPALPTSVHWTKIMEEVQAAVDQGTNLSGFVLDLLKAFNTLKWETTFMIAKQVGIPAQIIQGWRQALRGLRSLTGRCMASIQQVVDSLRETHSPFLPCS